MVSKQAATAIPQLVATAFLAAQSSSMASSIKEAGKRELTPENPLTTPTQRIGAWTRSRHSITGRPTDRAAVDQALLKSS
jgi:hypothetical protein